MQTSNMLDESNKLLFKINNEAKLRAVKREKRKQKLISVRKWTIRIAIVLFAVFALAFPVQTGEIIGTWLHDFIGTIYKNSIK